MTGLLLLAGGILAVSVAKLPPVRLPQPVGLFPLALDQWQGRAETLDSRIVELSGAEEAFNAAYFSPSGEIVSLYMGYRGSPFTESENFFHSPDVCLPSLGWKTVESRNHVIRAVPGVGRLRVRKMLIEKTGVRQLVYYWFQTRNRTAANVHLNRLHLTLHALARDNTYDVFIRPITPLDGLEPISSAEERLDGFVRSMMAALVPFLSAGEHSGK
jgi:EpsI family protein